jgi:hypothetical protein
MRFQGTTFDWMKSTGNVTLAIITPKRVAIDWNEQGTEWHLLANSDGNGSYRGTYDDGRRDQAREVEVELFKSASSKVVVMGYWRNRSSGAGSHIVFRLTPEPNNKPVSRKDAK